MTSNRPPQENDSEQPVDAHPVGESDAGIYEPDSDELADLLDQARDAAEEEDWDGVRDHLESALESLDSSDLALNDESWVSRTATSINWVVVAGIAIMLIGGVLWFRAGIGLENISDDLRVIDTFTNDVNRMKTILSLEDDRQSRQITQAVGIGAIVAGALITVYGYTRPRR